jgi:hypothetical protein
MHKLKRTITAIAALVGTLVLTANSFAQAPEIIVVGKEEVKKPQPTVQVIERPAVVSFDGNGNGGPELNIVAGFYVMKPFWESNSAFTRSTSTTVAGNTTSTSSTFDFSYGCELAPRIFAEFIGESGLGVRIGWWQFDQRATQLNPVLAAAPAGSPTVFILANVGGLSNVSLGAGQAENYTLANRLVVSVWDFDVLGRLISNDRWDVIGGAGIRYTYMSQTLDNTRVRSGLAAGVINNQESHSRQFFNVGGPDIFAEGKHYLGGSRLAIYANGRAGILFGSHHVSSTSITTTATGPGAATTSTSISTTDRRNDVLPFLETELGVEWQGRGNGRLVPFLRVGVVGQAWFGAGSGGSSGGADANMGFFGGNFLAGVSY